MLKLEQTAILSCDAIFKEETHELVDATWLIQNDADTKWLLDTVYFIYHLLINNCMHDM